MRETYLFNYEDGAAKSFIRFVESRNRTVTRLLSRDLKTPIKRL